MASKEKVSDSLDTVVSAMREMRLLQINSAFPRRLSYNSPTSRGSYNKGQAISGAAESGVYGAKCTKPSWRGTGTTVKHYGETYQSESVWLDKAQDNGKKQSRVSQRNYTLVGCPGSIEGRLDWSAALFSEGRVRQPLILGDNSLADLVAGWTVKPHSAQSVPLETHQHHSRPRLPFLRCKVFDKGHVVPGAWGQLRTLHKRHSDGHSHVSDGSQDSLRTETGNRY